MIGPKHEVEAITSVADALFQAGSTTVDIPSRVEGGPVYPLQGERVRLTAERGPSGQPHMVQLDHLPNGGEQPPVRLAGSTARTPADALGTLLFERPALRDTIVNRGRS